MSSRPEEDEELGRIDDKSPDPTHEPISSRELPPELKHFEARLTSLTPEGAGLDHDLVIFRAGQRSVEASLHTGVFRSTIMRTALTATSVVACAMFVLLLNRPIVYQTETASVPVVDHRMPESNNSRSIHPIELCPSCQMLKSKTQLVRDDAQIHSKYPSDGRIIAENRTSPAHAHGIPAARIRTASLETFDWMLQEEMTRAPAVDSTTSAEPSEVERSDGKPIPYLEQLRNVLRDQWHTSVLEDSFNSETRL